MLKELIQTAEALAPLVELVSGLGLITVLGAVLLAILKRHHERRMWRLFKSDVARWSKLVLEESARHPKEFQDNEWRAECEQMMYDAGFTATEISQNLELAILVAKATTIDFMFNSSR